MYVWSSLKELHTLISPSIIQKIRGFFCKPLLPLRCTGQSYSATSMAELMDSKRITISRGLLCTAVICLQSAQSSAHAAANGHEAGVGCFDIPRQSEDCYSRGALRMGSWVCESVVHTHCPTLCGTLPIQPCCNVPQLWEGWRRAAFCTRPDHQGRKPKNMWRLFTFCNLLSKWSRWDGVHICYGALHVCCHVSLICLSCEYFLTSSVETRLWKNAPVFPVWAGLTPAECAETYQLCSLFPVIEWCDFHWICSCNVHTSFIFSSKSPNKVIKLYFQVFGDTDSDGFYHGESGGLSGYVPSNMVDEILVDDKYLKHLLMQQGFLPVDHTGIYAGHCAVTHCQSTKIGRIQYGMGSCFYWSVNVNN